jgi:hypothetical protein
MFMKHLMRKKLAILGIDTCSALEMKNDLEKLGSVDVVSYKSKFPLFFPQWGSIRESEPSELTHSNHVEITLNNVVAVQLFEGPWGFSGNFIDENFSQSLKKEIESILAKNGYYTGRMAWKYAPWLPLIFLSAIVIFTLATGFHIFALIYTQHASTLKCVLIGINFICVLIGISLYRQFFS